MKKLAILAVILLAYMEGYCQTERGSFQLGVGGLPIIYPNGNEPTGYSLRANIGYFATKDLAVGLMPFYGKVDEISSTGVNLYVRYYILNGKIPFFAEASTGFGALNYKNSSELNGTMFSFTAGPGVGYLFNDKISVELLFQYGRLKNISFPERTMTGNTFIPTIGFQYFLRR